MFIKQEIFNLQSVFDDVENVQLGSFLTEEDIATISNDSDFFFNKAKRQKGVSMAVRNLRNRLIVPKNHYRHCTVVVQRLHNGYNFSKWLKRIANKIMCDEQTQIKVGFSFISWKPITNDRTYLFSAKALAPFQFTIDSKNKLLAEFSKIGSLTDSEILNKTFLNSFPDNPFSVSGFCPLKIVCSYVYITK